VKELWTRVENQRSKMMWQAYRKRRVTAR